MYQETSCQNIHKIKLQTFINYDLTMLLIFVTVFWEKHTYFRHLLSSFLNWTEELMV